MATKPMGEFSRERLELRERMLEPLERPDTQCRCAATDGIRCLKDADGEDLLCGECRGHMLPLDRLIGFGWYHTAELAERLAR